MSASAKVRESYSEVQQEDEGPAEYYAGYFEEQHRLTDADHCTNRRSGRSHTVELVSSLSLFRA